MERIAVQTVPTVHNLRYVHTKRDKLGHDLDLVEIEAADAEEPMAETPYIIGIGGTTRAGSSTEKALRFR